MLPECPGYSHFLAVNEMEDRQSCRGKQKICMKAGRKCYCNVRRVLYQPLCPGLLCSHSNPCSFLKCLMLFFGCQAQTLTPFFPYAFSQASLLHHGAYGSHSLSVVVPSTAFSTPFDSFTAIFNFKGEIPPSPMLTQVLIITNLTTKWLGWEHIIFL